LTAFTKSLKATSLPRSLLGLDGVHEVTEGDILTQILAWP